MLNTKKIEKLVKQLIAEIDPSPDREGLRDTPKRVAKYYKEVFEGCQYTNDQIVEMYDKTFEDEPNVTTLNDGLVVEKNIPIFSHCEHHIALMYDMHVCIAYIPRGKVIGLSKMARIAEMVGKRLQLQERIGADINYIMQKIVGTEDVAVIIEGKHACMTSRGVRSREAITSTAALSGIFKEDSALRQELYSIIRG